MHSDHQALVKMRNELALTKARAHMAKMAKLRGDLAKLNIAIGDIRAQQDQIATDIAMIAKTFATNH